MRARARSALLWQGRKSWFAQSPQRPQRRRPCGVAAMESRCSGRAEGAARKACGAQELSAISADSARTPSSPAGAVQRPLASAGLRRGKRRGRARPARGLPDTTGLVCVKSLRMASEVHTISQARPCVRGGAGRARCLAAHRGGIPPDCGPEIAGPPRIVIARTLPLEVRRPLCGSARPKR